jgi:hypothetical protein
MTTAKRYAWHVSVVMMVVVTSIAMMVLMLVIVDQSPPVTLIETSYTPGEFCPGDTVPYTVTWRVNRPANLEIIEGHLQRGVALVKDEHKAHIPAPTAGLLINRDSWIVPNLEPGRYDFSVGISANSEARLPAFLVQPYTIREDCEQ